MDVKIVENGMISFLDALLQLMRLLRLEVYLRNLGQIF
nr:MAG TPA: hypothetical protein [Caudoviricetes sp.]